MATKRQIFYSFHYKPDSWRAGTVRNIGAVEGNKPASDNDWEEVVGGGDEAIKKWIKGQLEYRSCALVLVGNQTADRKWINYEIREAWKSGMGVAGIYIHGLKNQDGYISDKGNNPFDYLNLGDKSLSEAVKCYNPAGTNSQDRYDWISRNIADIAEEAILIRNNY